MSDNSNTTDYECPLVKLNCPALPSDIENCIYDEGFDDEILEDFRRERINNCNFKRKYIRGIIVGDLKPRDFNNEVCPHYIDNQRGLCLKDKTPKDEEHMCPYRFLFNGDLEREVEGRGKVERCKS